MSDTDDVDAVIAEKELDPFIHMSEIFKYISHYRLRGHKIGRKVGDMLEILTMAALYRDPEIKKRLVVEPKLEGFSGAGHKVEFAVFDIGLNGTPIQSLDSLKGFIECKKVGVEQTVNGSFKKTFGKDNYVVPFNQSISVGFAPRWAPSASRFTILVGGNPNRPTLQVFLNGVPQRPHPVEAKERLIFGLGQDLQPFYIENDSSLRSKEVVVRMCKILEVVAITRAGVEVLLNDCLPGPQTPEKAKQASFVALDVRKARFGSFDKRPMERECVSMLVLTEFSHWERKSRRMIESVLDCNLVVEDSYIIEALRHYEGTFGLDFLERITKKDYSNAAQGKKDSLAAAKDIADAIVHKADGRIFRDISDNNNKEVRYIDGALVVK